MVMPISTKSLPFPVAHARKNFSDLVAQARGGQRIKLTRHGRDVAWLIGPNDREALKDTRSKRRTKRSSKP
jgi:prevent-host-death family protein